jgi:hypothetical protein
MHCLSLIMNTLSKNPSEVAEPIGENGTLPCLMTHAQDAHALDSAANHTAWLQRLNAILQA